MMIEQFGCSSDPVVSRRQQLTAAIFGDSDSEDDDAAAFEVRLSGSSRLVSQLLDNIGIRRSRCPHSRCLTSSIENAHKQEEEARQ